MTTKLTLQQKMLFLRELQIIVENEEWGSEHQVMAENLFWTLSERWFGVDWEGHEYLLKATTEEMMSYAFGVMKAICKEQGYEI